MEDATEQVRFKASPELIEKLKDWSEPVQIRIRPGEEGLYEMEARDPFGITEEMRIRGQEQALIEDARVAGEQLLHTFRRNLAALDAMPDGTLVYCQDHGCTGHPIETVR